MIFFSYSHADSEFALKLANDLINRGIVVWIDQLKIKGGGRYNKEIEAALESASTVIFIVTNQSIQSSYILDEVNFAVDENKTIIPVLLSQCKLPLRLRGFQHINFMGDYQKAFQSLLISLDVKESSKIIDKPYDSKEGIEKMLSSGNTPDNLKNDKLSHPEHQKRIVRADVVEGDTILPERKSDSKDHIPKEKFIVNNPYYWVIGGLLITIVLVISLIKYNRSSVDRYNEESSDSALTIPYVVADSADSHSSSPDTLVSNKVLLKEKQNSTYIDKLTATIVTVFRVDSIWDDKFRQLILNTSKESTYDITSGFDGNLKYDLTNFSTIVRVDDRTGNSFITCAYKVSSSANLGRAHLEYSPKNMQLSITFLDVNPSTNSSSGDFLVQALCQDSVVATFYFPRLKKLQGIEFISARISFGSKANGFFFSPEVEMQDSAFQRNSAGDQYTTIEKMSINCSAAIP